MTRMSGTESGNEMMASRKLNGLFILNEDSYHLIYGSDSLEQIGQLVNLYAKPQTANTIHADPALLAQADVIFSGWGAPLMDEAFLAAAPRLKAVFYGAGSIRGFVTDAFWQRHIIITSAAAANAVPVAEYTLATILLSLKKFWAFSAKTRQGTGWGEDRASIPGNFKRTVGLISLGMIARKVLELLAPFDLERVVYCPFLTDAEAARLNVRRCSLEEVFKIADVVSLHTPDIEATRGMITGTHFDSMKPGATFINTARGRVVREPEMTDVLQRRPDLTAVVDVTYPEPPASDSPLRSLPNVILTPHIAGSIGQECQRMGQYMTEELKRYLNGEKLRWQISQEAAARMA